jgi:hypothetical protein
MTPGQHDAAMVDLRRWPTGLVENRKPCPLNQCPAASGAPVGHGLFVEHCPALAANSLHIQKTTGSGRHFLCMNNP